MSTNREPCVILLPGLGADERLFSDLRGKAPAFVTPAWLMPLAGESLADYAQRWAPELQRLRADPEAPLVIGGMSFGGQVALELSRHLQPAAVLLLSSHPDASELTASFRRQVRILPMVPNRMLRWGMRKVALPSIARREGLTDEQRQRLLAMATAADLAFFRWASVAAQGWQWSVSDQAGGPVHRLHGERDRIIPLGCRDGVDVLEAGHLIPMTHAEQVAAWMRRVVDSCCVSR